MNPWAWLTLKCFTAFVLSCGGASAGHQVVGMITGSPVVQSWFGFLYPGVVGTAAYLSGFLDNMPQPWKKAPPTA